MSSLDQFIPSASRIPKAHIDPELFSALIEISYQLKQKKAFLEKNI